MLFFFIYWAFEKHLSSMLFKVWEWSKRRDRIWMESLAKVSVYVPSYLYIKAVTIT